MADKKNDSDDDDLDLFRTEMRDTKPIQHDRLLLAKPKPKAMLGDYRQQESLPAGDSFSDMLAPDLVGNEQYLEYRSSGIQHRQFAKLRAGKIHLEAELDLHGMTIAAAEAATSAFLHQCLQQQIRCVRIIHGKGWSSKDHKPLLKSQLNHSLRQRDHVLAFCSTPIGDGGSGALYVLLKRQSQD